MQIPSEDPPPEEARRQVARLRTADPGRRRLQRRLVVFVGGSGDSAEERERHKERQHYRNERISLPPARCSPYTRSVSLVAGERSVCGSRTALYIICTPRVPSMAAHITS